jgi:hypothetical protein
MNEADIVGVVDKMHAYVVLAEKESAKRKMQCQLLLEDELIWTHRGDYCNLYRTNYGRLRQQLSGNKR